jgi:hypothetical protein
MSKSKQRQINKRAQPESSRGSKLDAPNKKYEWQKGRAGCGFQSQPKKVEKTYWRK